MSLPSEYINNIDTDEVVKDLIYRLENLIELEDCNREDLRKLVKLLCKISKIDITLI